MQITDQYDQAIQFPSDVQEDLEKQGSDLRGELERLPDRDFALILAGIGQEGEQWKVRKFACSDARNTAEAVYAFLRFPQQLSATAEKLAAENLLRNVQDFGLTPPDELVEKAGSENPAPDTNFVLLPGELPMMKAAQAVEPQEEDPQIRTAEDVYDALAYFGDNDFAMDGWEKRALAKEIVGPAEEHGVRVPPRIEKYAADTYAVDLAETIVVRQQLCRAVEPTDEGFQKSAAAARAYDRLLASAPSLPPSEFAKQLGDLDKRANLAGRIPDAVFSTYGKRAAEPKPLFTYGPHTVYDEGLVHLAQRHSPLLKEQFGEHFVAEFRNDPTAVFQSLPHPQKLILARLASQKVGDDGVPT